MRITNFARLVFITALLMMTLAFHLSPGSVSADANETALNAPNALKQASITGGHLHTCALLETGAVQCWGYNGYGQLGDNSFTVRTTPTQVSGLTSGVIAISASYNHTCALLETGAVKCWGYNANGQLGDGGTTNRNIPTQVNGLTSGVIAISAGVYHSCALLATGAVKCWGNNTYAQLGDGTYVSKSTPTQVSGLTSGVVAISASYQHTCALLSTGAAKCWGSNSYGQLGDGTNAQRAVPTQVNGLTSGLTIISTGGYHTCGLLDTGAANCWGGNSYGQLGDGTTVTNRWTPTQVSGLSTGVTAISAGGLFTCALLNTGAANCWGLNDKGQVGDGTIVGQPAPIQVSGLSNGVAAINTGSGSHACALLVAGAAKCWGFNTDGQLGNSTRTDSSTPVQVSGLTSGVGATTTSTTSTTTTTTTTTTVAPTSTSTSPSSSTTSSTTTPKIGLASQTSTSAPTNPVVTAPSTMSGASTTTIASSTTEPNPTIDVEQFIGASTQEVSMLAKEADSERGAALLINGKSVPVQIETTTSSVTMSFAEASLEVKCFDADGSEIPLSGEGRFTVRRGDSVSVTAKGFAPQSSINVAVFSDPIALGSVVSNTEGTASQQWKIPRSIAPGDHTLVVSGDLANVENTVFGLRVIIDQKSFITRITSSTWTRVIVVLGILGGLLIPANRRRQGLA